MDTGYWEILKVLAGYIIGALFICGLLITLVRHGVNESERVERIEAMLLKLLEKEGVDTSDIYAKHKKGAK